jgi:hypothetical protein
LKEKKERRKGPILGVVIILTFAFSLSNIIAQDAIPATGSDAAGSGGSVSYSVPATYVLKVIGNNKEIKAFKIIKNLK